MTEAPGNYAQLPVDKIVPSPYQYRKTFGGTEDKELADSIRIHGVLQPIRVRPNGKPGTFELVFGERRWRAACAAELDLIPAIVVDLTDDQVIEQLIVENLQRKDVHPIEEGEGYWQLLNKHGYTEEQIIAKTGRSKAYIYGRIKLAKDLAPGPRKAVLEGRLPMAHAELIARLGDAKLQEQCTRIVLGKLDHRDDDEIVDDLETIGIQHELVSEDGKWARQHQDAQLLSYRATKALIRQKFTTKLALAKFSTSDAGLTSAGACTSCPHRSGNQPQLPGLVEVKGDDLCLRPSCYEEKNQAAWKRAAASAKERGLAVVDDAKKEKVFGYDGVSITSDSPYVELDAQLPYDLQKSPGSKATWKKLLGKRADEVPRVLVQDESGAPRELLDKGAAKKILLDEGKIDKPAKPKASSSSNSNYADRKKENSKRELHMAAFTRVLEQIGSVSKAGDDSADYKKNLAWLRWIGRAASRVVCEAGSAATNEYLEQLDCSFHDDYGDKIFVAKTLGEVRALVVKILLAEHADGKISGFQSKHDHDLFDEALKLGGIDWDKAVDAAKAAAKAEEKADAAKDAKKKEPAKQAPAKKAKKGKGK